jgi:hypothetical protein
MAVDSLVAKASVSKGGRLAKKDIVFGQSALKSLREAKAATSGLKVGSPAAAAVAKRHISGINLSRGSQKLRKEVGWAKAALARDAILRRGLPKGNLKQISVVSKLSNAAKHVRSSALLSRLRGGQAPKALTGSGSKTVTERLAAMPRKLVSARTSHPRFDRRKTGGARNQVTMASRLDQQAKTTRGAKINRSEKQRRAISSRSIKGSKNSLGKKVNSRILESKAQTGKRGTVANELRKRKMSSVIAKFKKDQLIKRRLQEGRIKFSNHKSLRVHLKNLSDVRRQVVRKIDEQKRKIAFAANRSSRVAANVQAQQRKAQLANHRAREAELRIKAQKREIRRVATRAVTKQVRSKVEIVDNGNSSGYPSKTSGYFKLSDAAFLKEIARRAERKIRATGAVAGSRKHSYAERLTNRYQRLTGQRRNLVTEQSYLNGAQVSRGTTGSVRPDVYDPSSGAIYDYKFTVRPRRGMSLRQQGRNLRNVPHVTSQSEINP